MSVIVKGMEKPEACLACDFCNPFTEKPYCRRLMKVTPKTTTLPDCPLIEIPPHGRLIDADEISKHKYATIPPYRKEYSDGKPKSEDEVIAFKFGWNDAIDAIVANAPAIIESEGE